MSKINKAMPDVNVKLGDDLLRRPLPARSKPSQMGASPEEIIADVIAFVNALVQAVITAIQNGWVTFDKKDFKCPKCGKIITEYVVGGRLIILWVYIKATWDPSDGYSHFRFSLAK